MNGIKYRKPEEMKDSGIEWLGRMPCEWDIKKIKYNSYVKGRIGWQGLRAEEFIDFGPFLVTGTDFVDGRVNWDTCYHISEVRYKEAPEIHLKDNDLLITKDGSIGKLAIVRDCPDKAILNSGIFVTRCLNNTYLSRYMFYLLSSKMFGIYIDLSSNGSTIRHLYQATFVNFSFALPKIKEQQKIANFLDIKTAQFDSIIAKKELLIKKLEEAKSSLISEVVTGKVKVIGGEMVPRQPAEMKDSGVEWLGMIPKDWEVKRLKYLMQINPSKSEIIDKNQDCSFVPMNKIHNAIIDTDETKKIKEVYEGYTYFADGDIIMAKVTPCFENGDIAVASDLINGVGFGTTEIHVFRVNSDYDTSFIFYLLQENHFKRYGSNHMTGVAGLKRVPTSYISNFKIAIPDLNEQKYLSNFIENEICKIKNIRISIQLQIQKLKQAKQSLITEAVTGKIDLREWKII